MKLSLIEVIPYEQMKRLAADYFNGYKVRIFLYLLCCAFIGLVCAYLFDHLVRVIHLGSIAFAAGVLLGAFGFKLLIRLFFGD